jgi:hypothetical protein
MRIRSRQRIIWLATLATLAAMLFSCARQERVGISPARNVPQREPNAPVGTPTGKLDPIPRYGGYVLTTTGMPQSRGTAYLWAKNTGTLVAYETFLRKYPDGEEADFFRSEIRTRFLPQEEEWHEAWLLYSKMEIIDGAICNPEEGFILLGRPGSGRLPPFFYEDLIVALKCSLAKEKVGVTMNRVFAARFKTPDDPRQPPYEEYETSVDFYSKTLWNTHVAYVLFEGDRMLKSLGSGYDLFLREPIRSKIPGFATEVEMEALQVRDPSGASGTGQYGRVWIELTSVRINTTEQKNVAMFDDVQLEVRAESKYPPPVRFAKHIQENYKAYSEEFPIFGEVERTARVVAIARWLFETYPEVFVPQVIPGRAILAHDEPTYRSWLIGGVYFPNVNRTQVAGQAKIGETTLDDAGPKVLQARKGNASAWEVPLGSGPREKYVAWCVSAMRPQVKAVARLDTKP